MRKELYHRSAQKTDQMVHPLPSTLPWKEYIANHLEADQIIGPGITRASLQFIEGAKDPNRLGQLRLDFAFETIDGGHCRLHPGNKPKGEARTVFVPPVERRRGDLHPATGEVTSSTYWEATPPNHPNWPACGKVTLEDLSRIPQHLQIGKSCA